MNEDNTREEYVDRPLNTPLILRIRELDTNMIRPNIQDVWVDRNTSSGSKIIAIGASGTGKSSIIKSLLYEKRQLFPVAMVQSATEALTNFFSSFMPSTFIYNKLNLDAIKQFIIRQNMVLNSIENPFAVLVLDDVAEEPKILNTTIFQNIFKQSRHYGMMFILALQYAMDIKPSIRANIDGTFILREGKLNLRKALWQNYASCIDDFKVFCDLMDNLTSDYTSIYIHNRSSSNRIEDCVFYYKARDDIPDTQWFGTDVIWDYNQQRYDENYQPNFLD